MSVRASRPGTDPPVPQGDGGAPRPDLRLVLPAAAVWGGAALGGSSGHGWVLAVSAAAALLAAARVICGPRSPAARPAGAVVTLTCLICLSAGWLVAEIGVRARGSGPLVSLARAGASADIAVKVSGDPAVRPSRVSSAGRTGDLVLIPATATSVKTASRAWSLRQPVLLIVSGPGPWLNLLPSQRVDLTGKLASPRPGDTVTAVVFVRSPPRRVGRPTVVQSVAGRLRAGLREASRPLPRRERGLLPGLVVGDTSRLDQDVQDDFRTSGMTHLVAVSGSNCAVVAGVALALGRRARLGLRSRAVWTAAALVGFVVLARPSPSVLRAGVMGLLAVVAAGTGRTRSTIPLLAAAVGLLLLLEPTLATSIGFALSVFSTAGLLVLAPGWAEALGRRMPDRLAEAVAVPLAAQLACAPLIVWFAGSVSTVAVAANLLALPAVPPATIAGIAAALTAPVASPLAAGCARLAAIPCWWLVTVAHIGARVPGATVAWPAGVVGAVGLVVVLVALTCAVRRRRSRRAVVAACVGLAVAQVTAVPWVAPGWPPPGWRMVMCDVGQGDALVLPAGPGSAVLVDAGPDPALLGSCLHDLGVRRIALLILSHLHADHVEGLPAVLGHLPVGGVEIGPLLEPPAEWSRVRRWTAAAHVPITRARLGETGRVGSVAWRVLAPVEVLHGTDSDPNDNSVVMRVDTPDLSLLLMGDAEPEEQAQLRGRPDLRVDVLKVAHHGSARQDPDLLAATGATVALISVGAGNSYGHPASRTLRALVGDGVRVFRTDLDGSLAVSKRDGVVTVTRRRRSRGTGGRPLPPRATPGRDGQNAAGSPLGSVECPGRPVAVRDGAARSPPMRSWAGVTCSLV